MVANITDDECVWATLMFDHEFACEVRKTVSEWSFTSGLNQPACTCDPALPITPARALTYDRPQLPTRSLTGLNVLAYTRTTPDYNRQLGIDERY